MKKDMTESFAKFIGSTYENIDGMLVEKGFKDGQPGYMCLGVFCKDIQEVKATRDYAANAIKVSIVNPDGKTQQLSKKYSDKYLQGQSGYVEYKRDQIKKSEQED